MQKWPAVLVTGRGIHCDQGAIFEACAEIAAEAGIGGSRSETEVFAGKKAFQP